MPEEHTVAQLGRCILDFEPHIENDGCREWSRTSFPARYACSCGAHWTVSEKELHEGTDHIEDHLRYAKRTETRVD